METRKQKIIAIMGGGDWVDASVNHIVPLGDFSMEELEIKYKNWYNTIYLPTVKEVKNTLNYKSIDEWLIENNFARRPNEDELEEYWD